LVISSALNQSVLGAADSKAADSKFRSSGSVPVDEKRVLPRFPLEMPVWLRLPGSDATVHAKTRDVSASGVFFYVNCEIREDAEIEFTMTLPPELTRTAAIQVSCKGKVVRVTNDNVTGKIGIAASIHSYDFLAQAASSSFGDA
jgi:hypothetical protein